MKSFSRELPENDNVKGSGIGAPALDMNKVSNALVEIRSSVPNTPSDIDAATATQLTGLSNRISALVSRINALKSTPFADAFSRTSLGSLYTLVSGSTPTLASNQIAQGSASSFFVANQATKTYHMRADLTLLVDSTTVGHPQLVINYLSGSYYRAVYSVTAGAWEIYKVLNSSETLLGSQTDVRPSSTYTMTLSQFQNTITLSVNNAVKLSVPDATPLVGKQAGINFPSVSSSAPTRFVDNFSYQDL